MRNRGNARIYGRLNMALTPEAHWKGCNPSWHPNANHRRLSGLQPATWSAHARFVAPPRLK